MYNCPKCQTKAVSIEETVDDQERPIEVHTCEECGWMAERAGDVYPEPASRPDLA